MLKQCNQQVKKKKKKTWRINLLNLFFISLHNAEKALQYSDNFICLWFIYKMLSYKFAFTSLLQRYLLFLYVNLAKK